MNKYKKTLEGFTSGRLASVKVISDKLLPRLHSRHYSYPIRDLSYLIHCSPDWTEILLHESRTDTVITRRTGIRSLNWRDLVSRVWVNGIFLHSTLLQTLRDSFTQHPTLHDRFVYNTLSYPTPCKPTRSHMIPRFRDTVVVLRVFTGLTRNDVYVTGVDVQEKLWMEWEREVSVRLLTRVPVAMLKV